MTKRLYHHQPVAMDTDRAVFDYLESLIQTGIPSPCFWVVIFGVERKISITTQKQGA